MALTRAGLKVALSLTDCERNTIVRKEAGFPLKPACKTGTLALGPAAELNN